MIAVARRVAAAVGTQWAAAGIGGRVLIAAALVAAAALFGAFLFGAWHVLFGGFVKGNWRAGAFGFWLAIGTGIALAAETVAWRRLVR